MKRDELDIQFHGHLSRSYPGFLDNHSWLDIMEKIGFFAILTPVCVDALELWKHNYSPINREVNRGQNSSA